MPMSALHRAVKYLAHDDIDDDDVDFDRRVADLLVEEAREKLSGVSSPSTVPTRRHATNTRFLTNVVRGVQSHNRSLRAGPLEPGTGAGPSHSRQGSHLQHQQSRDEIRSEGNARTSKEDVEMRPPQSGRDSSESRGRLRTWSDDENSISQQLTRPVNDEGEDRRRRRRSRSPRNHQRHNTSFEEKSDDRRRRRRIERDSDHGERKSLRKPREGNSRRRSSKEETRRRDDEATATSRVTPIDLESSHPSKMDRYFDKHYDPMLDVSGDVRTDENGLIEDDGWDRMLHVLKEKKERKSARKSGSRSRSDCQNDELQESAGLMTTKYTQRGKIREWDLGKDS